MDLRSQLKKGGGGGGRDLDSLDAPTTLSAPAKLAAVQTPILRTETYYGICDLLLWLDYKGWPAKTRWLSEHRLHY